MLYGMYQSAAGALANWYRLDVEANNMANADTVGFKRDLALLQARPTEAEQSGLTRSTSALLEGLGGGTFALPTYTSFSPGSLESTKNPYDLALPGKGFFQLQNGSQINYTRDGRFTLNRQNQLVSVSSQLPVLNNAGQSIVLDPTSNFQVNQQGTISQNNTAVATLGIVDFEDTRNLKKNGRNLFVPQNDAQPRPVDAAVKQFSIELSGVDPMTEITELIKSSRMLEANLNMLRLQDESLGLAVSKVGSVA